MHLNCPSRQKSETDGIGIRLPNQVPDSSHSPQSAFGPIAVEYNLQHCTGSGRLAHHVENLLLARY